MAYSQHIIERRKVWRASLPPSIDSCVKFAKVKDAEKHAKEMSLKKSEYRHVIHTGDHYFSSTTAIVFWYEKLVISYYDGRVVENYKDENDLKNEEL